MKCTTTYNNPFLTIIFVLIIFFTGMLVGHFHSKSIFMKTRNEKNIEIYNRSVKSIEKYKTVPQDSLATFLLESMYFNF